MAVGWNDDLVKNNRGREEIFEIDKDEQLIGCEIDYSKDCFRGVSWIKMKVFDYNGVEDTDSGLHTDSDLGEINCENKDCTYLNCSHSENC